MLSREINVSSNLMSYRGRKATQIPGNSNFVWSVSLKLLKETWLLYLLSYDISAYLFFRFAYLTYYCFCVMLFSVSHSSIVNIFYCLCCMPDVEQIIKDTNTCASFSITQWQSSISWMVKEFVIVSEEVFLMYKFV